MSIQEFNIITFGEWDRAQSSTSNQRPANHHQQSTFGGAGYWAPQQQQHQEDPVGAGFDYGAPQYDGHANQAGFAVNLWDPSGQVPTDNLMFDGRYQVPSNDMVLDQQAPFPAPPAIPVPSTTDLRPQNAPQRSPTTESAQDSGSQAAIVEPAVRRGRGRPRIHHTEEDVKSAHKGSEAKRRDGIRSKLSGLYSKIPGNDRAKAKDEAHMYLTIHEYAVQQLRRRQQLLEEARRRGLDTAALELPQETVDLLAENGP